MVNFTFTAWRRKIGDRDALVLKCELNEDAFTHGPFLKRKIEPLRSMLAYELNFHQGWPQGAVKTGRKVTFEHVEPNLFPFVKMIRVYLEGGESVTVDTQQKSERQAPREWPYGDPRDREDRR